MKILNNTSFIQFKGLVPIKNYKGPILKLTEAEQTKIKAIQDNITQLEIELFNLQSFYKNKKFQTRELEYFIDKEYKIKDQIEEFKNIIRDIKINSLNKQKTKR